MIFYAKFIQMCLFQFHFERDWYFGTGGQQLFVKHQCKVSNCFITNNRYYIFLDTLINVILFFGLKFKSIVSSLGIFSDKFLEDSYFLLCCTLYLVQKN